MTEPNRQHQPCTHFVLLEQEGNDKSRQIGENFFQAIGDKRFYLFFSSHEARSRHEGVGKYHQSCTSFPGMAGSAKPGAPRCGAD
jgi:hypothetical protein